MSLDDSTVRIAQVEVVAREDLFIIIFVGINFGISRLWQVLQQPFEVWRP